MKAEDCHVPTMKPIRLNLMNRKTFSPFCTASPKNNIISNPLPSPISKCIRKGQVRNTSLPSNSAHVGHFAAPGYQDSTFGRQGFVNISIRVAARERPTVMAISEGAS